MEQPGLNNAENVNSHLLRFGFSNILTSFQRLGRARIAGEREAQQGVEREGFPQEFRVGRFQDSRSTGLQKAENMSLLRSMPDVREKRNDKPRRKTQ